MRFDYLENPSLQQQAMTEHYDIAEQEAVNMLLAQINLTSEQNAQIHAHAAKPNRPGWHHRSRHYREQTRTSPRAYFVSPSDPLLQIENLKVIFHGDRGSVTHAVDCLDLTIGRGQTFGNGGADAFGCAGDDGDLAGQPLRRVLQHCLHGSVAHVRCPLQQPCRCCFAE